MSFVISRTQYDLLFKKILNHLQPGSNPELQLQKLGLEITGLNDNFKPPIHRLNDTEVYLLACLAGNQQPWVNKDVLKQQCASCADEAVLSQGIQHLLQLEILVQNDKAIAIMPLSDRRAHNAPPSIRASLFPPATNKRPHKADNDGANKKQKTKIAALEAKQTQLIKDFANATADRVSLRQEISLMLDAIAKRNGIEAANKITVKITQGQRLFTVSPNSAFERVEVSSDFEVARITARAVTPVK